MPRPLGAVPYGMSDAMTPAAAASPSYYQGLAYNTSQLAPRAERCVACCHWALPLGVPARSVPGGTVRLRYEEWLTYHWHVVLHQQGCPVLPA